MSKTETALPTAVETARALAHAVISHPRVTDKSQGAVASKVAQRLNKAGVKCDIPGNPGYFTRYEVLAMFAKAGVDFPVKA